MKGLNWRAAWSAATTYAVDDAVSQGGSSWVSLTGANLNVTPGTDPTKWSLLASKGDTGATGAAGVGTQRVYRWATFQTYDQFGAWNMGNSPALYGGVPPSTWTDANGTAPQMSSDKEVLRTLFVNKAYPGLNATVFSATEMTFSSTNGRVVTALFRIRNTTASPINWSPQFWYSCYAPWGELASVALNGTAAFTGVCNTGIQPVQSITMSIPANRTSTVIFISTSGSPYSIASGIFSRSTVLGFINNTLGLPAGLEFIDDLDTATGDYSQ